MNHAHRLVIHAKKELATHLGGTHLSLTKGSGYDLVHLRPYVEGDEIRNIDWNLSSKMDEIYVKVTQEEKGIPLVLLPLLSGSLHFGSVVLKHEYIGTLMSLLGMSALYAKDPLFCGLYDGVRNHLTPPVTTQKTFTHTLYEYLNHDTIGKSCDYTFIENDLMKRLKRKSLIVFIGDFFPEKGEIPATTFRKLALKHEVVTIMVRDPLEEHPESFEISHFCDPQTLEKKEIIFDYQTREKIYQTLHDADSALMKGWSQSGIRYKKVFTHLQPLGQLVQLFRSR